MKIKSNTTKISDEQWKEWVRLLKPNGCNLDGWALQIQSSESTGTSGRAWKYGRKIHIRVGQPWRNSRRPYVRPGGGGYLPSTVYTYEESIMLVLAHELRHAWQYQHPRGRRVWGSRSQTSERDADAYAIHAVRVERRRLSSDAASAACPS